MRKALPAYESGQQVSAPASVVEIYICHICWLFICGFNVCLNLVFHLYLLLPVSHFYTFMTWSVQVKINVHLNW